MLDYLLNNLATVLVGAVVFAGVAAAVWKLVRDRQRGQCSCGCPGGCKGCPSAQLCHKRP